MCGMYGMYGMYGMARNVISSPYKPTSVRITFSILYQEGSMTLGGFSHNLVCMKTQEIVCLFTCLHVCLHVCCRCAIALLLIQLVVCYEKCEKVGGRINNRVNCYHCRAQIYHTSLHTMAPLF